MTIAIWPTEFAGWLSPCGHGETAAWRLIVAFLTIKPPSLHHVPMFGLEDTQTTRPGKRTLALDKTS